jgi:hypothetical protein
MAEQKGRVVVQKQPGLPATSSKHMREKRLVRSMTYHKYGWKFLILNAAAATYLSRVPMYMGCHVP